MYSRLGKLICYTLVYLLVTGRAETAVSAGLRWHHMSTRLDDRALQSIAVNPLDPDFLLVGSASDIYRSLDGGERWERVFRLSGSDARIHRIAIHPDDVNLVFLLTSRGLSVSRDQGRTWQSTGMGLGENRLQSLSIAFHPRSRSTAVLGTRHGIFVTHDAGLSWRRTFASLSDREIRAIVFDPVRRGQLLAATPNAVYRLYRDEIHYERLFQVRADEDDAISEESGDAPFDHDGIQNLLRSPVEKETYFLVHHAAIYVSRDRGKHWLAMPVPLHASSRIRDAAVSAVDGSIFVATSSGFYMKAENGRAVRDLYQGISTGDHRATTVVEDFEERVLTVTAQGLYLLPRIVSPWITEIPVTPPSQRALALYQAWIRSEPAVTRVQQVAAQYANVDGGKIRRWHWGSRLSSLFPEISIDAGWSEDSNIDLDRATSSIDDAFIIGPDDRSFDMGISADWDLGDFIWDTAQTSIDVREKLMVELRDELLREITRLYFERRREQLAYASHIMQLAEEANPDAEPPVLLPADTAIRIEELAGQMDALTGQRFASEWTTPDRARDLYKPAADALGHTDGLHVVG